MHKEQHKIEKKLKILTSSMALRSQPPTLTENHMIQTTTEDYGEIFWMIPSEDQQQQKPRS